MNYKINYEIVVINDYSDDDSYKIIEEKSKNEKVCVEKRVI